MGCTPFPPAANKSAVRCIHDQVTGGEDAGGAELVRGLAQVVRTHGCKVEFIKVISDNDDQPMLA